MEPFYNLYFMGEVKMKYEELMRLVPHLKKLWDLNDPEAKKAVASLMIEIYGNMRRRQLDTDNIFYLIGAIIWILILGALITRLF